MSKLQNQKTFTIGDLFITRDSRVVTLNGNDVRLSSKEHALMLALAENGRYMHQGDILAHMGYARAEMPEEKIVDVFVCKIRKKFRKVAPVGQYIESVPGSGYRVFKAPALLSVA